MGGSRACGGCISWPLCKRYSIPLDLLSEAWLAGSTPALVREVQWMFLSPRDNFGYRTPVVSDDSYRTSIVSTVCMS